MSRYFTSGGKTYTLQSSISSTATSITLTSFTVPVSGTSITMAVMNTDVAYGTIAPRTSNAEFISFTGVTQNADGTATLTGVTRGLDKNYPYTTSSTFKLPHAGSTQFILSDAPQVFNQYSVIANDETITGQKTFPSSGGASSALVGVSYVAPTQDTEIASKKYVDLVATFGAPFATTTTAGIVQFPTDAQREAGTDTGSSTGGLVLPNRQYGARFIGGYSSSGGAVNAITVTLTPAPTTLATGLIAGFNVTTNPTGNTTFSPNGLTAKNIFLGGTGLFAGAFSTSMNVGVQYNGTQWDVIWRSQGESASATKNLLALRNNTGDVTVNTTPTATTDAASKAYVDSIGLGFVASSGTTIAAVGNTTQNVATISIVGGTLSTNKGVRIRIASKVQIAATNGGATFNLSYGGTNIASWSLTGASGTPTETDNINSEILLMGAGTTGTQLGNGMHNYQIVSGSAATQGNKADQTTASIDSTVDKNLLLSVVSNSTAATGSLIGYFVEKIT